MRLSLLAAGLGAGLIAATPAGAQTFTWQGGGGNNAWSTAANWQGGVAPPSNLTTTDVVFGNSTAVFPSISSAYNVHSLMFSSGASAFNFDTGPLTLGAGGLIQIAAKAQGFSAPLVLGAAQTWTLANGAGALNVAGGVNSNGFGLTINAATVSATGDVINGSFTGTGSLTKTGSGTLDLIGANSYSGPTTASAGILQVGAGGSLTNTQVTGNSGGTFTISGGSVSTGGYFVVAGGVATTPATVNLTAGSLAAGETDVGNLGTGLFTQTGGTHTVGGLSLGQGTGNGAYSLSGTGQVSASSEAVGYSAPGTFTQSGGANTLSGDLYLGYGVGSVGSYTLSGTGQLSTNITYVGSSGNGTFSQTGGTHTVGAGLVIGVGVGTTGTYALSGAGLLSTPDTGVGVSGNGTFVQSGGAHAVNGPLYLGVNAGGSGAYNLQSGTLSTMVTEVGYGGAGTFTQTGGANTVAGNGGVNMGVFPGSSGIYVLSGGTLQTAFVSGNPSGGTSTLDFNGGTLQANSDNSSFLTTLTTAAVQAGGAVIDTNGHAVTISQQLLHDAAGLGTSFDGGLIKRGAGTLTLTGANTYTGGTVISAGTLSVASNANLGDPSGAVTIQSTGQLAFLGSVTTGRVFNLNAASLAAPAGGTITLSGAAVIGGFLRGPGTFIVTNGTALSGATTFVSTSINQTGASSYTNFSNGGALTVAPGVAGPITMNGYTNEGSGSIAVGAVSVVNVADFQSYGLLTLTPAVVGSNAFTELTNTGTAPLYFNGGSRTFLGTAATAINPATGQPADLAGINLNGQNAVVAGGLFVNNGFVADGSAAGTATIIADFGSLVKGAGFFQNPVITQNGGKFQAGNSPGSAAFGSFIIGPGGVNSYVFAIDDATGTAGPSPDALGHVSGWGLVKSIQRAVGSFTSSGNFTWTATPADPLSVALDTLVNPTSVGTDVSGPMADFDPTRAYSWPAVKWSGTYSGPTDLAALDAATSFDTTGFENPINGTFGWSLDAADRTLSLTYTPVPEPGTLALTGMAAIGWVTFWRRRWKSNGPAATSA